MRRHIWPALSVAALLCGPHALADEADTNATSAPNAEPSDKRGLPVDTAGLKSGCFYARDVGNWVALNREYLIVYAPGKSRPYLVKITPPSINLRSVSTIGFEGGDRICGRPGERLLIDRSRGPNFIIMDVWRLDAAAAERILEKRKARDSGKVEPAGDSPGAVVETDIKAGGAGDSDADDSAAGATATDSD